MQELFVETVFTDENCIIPLSHEFSIGIPPVFEQWALICESVSIRIF
jgi:hypothetical protein